MKMNQTYFGPKPNPSGHINFDVPSLLFYKEYNRREHNLERMRSEGTLKQRKSRNPLNYEATPRNYELEHFDFSVPPADPKLQIEKWDYPKSDWGLMAKFRSQKHIYDDIYMREQEYHKRMSELRELRDKNQKKINSAILKQQEKLYNDKTYGDDSTRNLTVIDEFDAKLLDGNKGSSKNNSSSQYDKFASEEMENTLRKDREHKEHLAQQKAKLGYHTKLFNQEVKVVPKDLYSQKISTFKDLNKTHPDVVAEWRAKRAADFVSSLNSIDPPKPNPLPATSFLPAGKSTINFRNKKRNNTIEQGKAVSVGGIDMDLIHQQLIQTEEELSRQQLKIKLNAKPMMHHQAAR